MPLPERCGLVFDLDDTLYDEREFVYSGFQAISSFLVERGDGPCYARLLELFEAGNKKVFQTVLNELKSDISPDVLLRLYREHTPQLQLEPAVRSLLSDLVESGHALGIITDGRSTTQRNKIVALGLDQWFSEIVVSEEIGVEKPSPTAYRLLQERFARECMVYVGDNPTKDFLAPNQLGWLTVCVRARATNIHTQDFADLPKVYQPAYVIDHLTKN